MEPMPAREPMGSGDSGEAEDPSQPHSPVLHFVDATTCTLAATLSYRNVPTYSVVMPLFGHRGLPRSLAVISRAGRQDFVSIECCRETEHHNRQGQELGKSQL